MLIVLVNAAARVLSPPLAALVALVFAIPQMAVTIRRLHDVNKSGRELILPLGMLAVAPLMYSFGGFIARIVVLGYLGLLLLVFANLLLMLARKGSNIPNKYGKSPDAFSFGN